MYRVRRVVWLWFRHDSTFLEIVGFLGSVRWHSAAFGFSPWSIKIGYMGVQGVIHVPTDVLVINIRF